MEPLTYEQALEELQSIVRNLQDDAVGIDELSEKIRRAAELIRFCRSRLRQAKGEVEELFKDDGMME